MEHTVAGSVQRWPRFSLSPPQSGEMVGLRGKAALILGTFTFIPSRPPLTLTLQMGRGSPEWSCRLSQRLHKKSNSTYISSREHRPTREPHCASRGEQHAHVSPWPGSGSEHIDWPMVMKRTEKGDFFQRVPELG